MTTRFVPFAVRATQVQESGCPHCGYKFNRPTLLGGELRVCGNCQRGFAQVGDYDVTSCVQYDGSVLFTTQHPKSGKSAWDDLSIGDQPVTRKERNDMLLACYKVGREGGAFSEAEAFFSSKLGSEIVGKALGVLALNDCVIGVEGPDLTQRYYQLTVVGRSEAAFLLSAIN